MAVYAERSPMTGQKESKEKILISFSGGRTSGYMTKMMMDRYSDEYEFIVVFANTGQEHEGTLEFVHNCDRYFNFNTVWVEAIINPEKGKGIRHKIVTYETASRTGQPYEDMIKKYGIPNQAGPFCSNYLKRYPIESYMKSIGMKNKSYKTAIGIRTDETRRVSKSAGVRNIIYPLVDMIPSDKQDVLDWWEDQIFDLDIPEHHGNCVWCWKKSFSKLLDIMEVTPSAFDFPARMEAEHGFQDLTEQPENPYTFYRGATSTARLREMFTERGTATGKVIPIARMYEDSGCSESCEVYTMEGDVELPEEEDD